MSGAEKRLRRDELAPRGTPVSQAEGAHGIEATPASGAVAAGWPPLRVPEAWASPPCPRATASSAGAAQTRWPVAGLQGLYTCEADQLTRQSKRGPAGTTGRHPRLPAGRSGTAQTADGRRCDAGARGRRLAARAGLDRRGLGTPRHPAERKDRQTQALYSRANRNGPD
jgi:hypothetical protein